MKLIALAIAALALGACKSTPSNQTSVPTGGGFVQPAK